MINLSGMISIPFLKKSVFTGSYLGMRYLLRKDERVIEEAREGEPAKTAPVLTAIIWPEPFNYGMTAEDKKHRHEFPFDQDGLLAAVAWLNAAYEARQYEGQEEGKL